MIDFCSFNVRGLNNKCDFIKDFLAHNKLSLVGLIETRVRADIAKTISKEIAPSFSWLYNYDFHQGGRIWVGWNHFLWNLTLISASDQHITCNVSSLQYNASFVVTFVYGLHTTVERRRLWTDLNNIASSIGDSPWVLCGDFNIFLDLNEAEGGSPHWYSGMSEFKDCLMKLGLTDLRSVGSFFTWWDSNTIMPKFRKLDRVLINHHWHKFFPLSLANFLPRGISDHNPAATSLGIQIEHKPKPFQFYHFMLDHPDFLDVVQNAWGEPVYGDPWFVVTTKLKKVKTALKTLNARFGNVHSAVDNSRNALFNFQSTLPRLPSQNQLEQENRLISEYIKDLGIEEKFLKQKSRVQWLKHGDGNSKFFYNSCRGRWNCNKILSLEDDNGVVYDSHDSMAAVAINYFQSLLGSNKEVIDLPVDVQLPCLNSTIARELEKEYTGAEVFETLKKMAKGKSPGPDGFTVEFYIHAWSCVGQDVTKAVLYFFDTLYMPRIINSAAITLVPKVAQATKMAQFRPIACCNVLYKCISKMLTCRLKRTLPELISLHQSAFIPKRSIGDNIFLAQALCRDYHRNDIQPRCAIKLDVHKAFDSLNWKFLFEAMRRMGFPEGFLNWIRPCITS